MDSEAHRREVGAVHIELPRDVKALALDHVNAAMIMPLPCTLPSTVTKPCSGDELVNRVEGHRQRS